MAMTAEEFLKMMEEKRKRQGFENKLEAFGAAFNWREVFGTDLPNNYYHPRDKHILEEGMCGLRTGPPNDLENPDYLSN